MGTSIPNDNAELERLASEALLESEEDAELGPKIVAKFAEQTDAIAELGRLLEDSRLRELPSDLRESIASKHRLAKEINDRNQALIGALVASPEPQPEDGEQPVGRRGRGKSRS